MIAFMAEKPSVVASLSQPRPVKFNQPHEIRFEQVSFHYPNTKNDVLSNLTFEIKADDTVVLVGLNGAGKTTLIKLLTRLYDPTAGIIYLDGYDIKEYDVQELYKLFGIVFQDFGKYAVSVEENIAFGKIATPLNEPQVIAAAKQSNAYKFIETLPGKFQTPLMRIFETDGRELSIGQWQKLAIARAFYSQADILILDEPTASLDALAEQEIYEQFDRLRQNKISLFVSHRLSSATLASKILVLKDGEIIESGNHQSLMAAHGHYHELFTTQASRYLLEAENQD